MAAGGRKEFGRRGVEPPPVVANAPKGLADAPRGPSLLRKRSLGVALISIGAVSLGGYAAYEATHRECAATGDPPQEDCRRSSGASHGGSSGRSWFFGGLGSGNSTSAAHEGGSSHSSIFGGFGRMGSFHFGGGS
jgi:hypothetical protein